MINFSDNGKGKFKKLRNDRGVFGRLGATTSKYM